MSMLNLKYLNVRYLDQVDQLIVIFQYARGIDDLVFIVIQRKDSCCCGLEFEI